jgi:hypothetical protein
VKIGMKGYRLLTRAAVPAAMGYLLYRSRRQPAYRNFWGERFGFSEYPPPKGCPRVWVHAVSVGETNAAKPLIAECLKRWPEADFLLTHMTPTGRDAGKRIVALAPDRISQCYLPYDIPGAMESFFRETKPSIGIVMETEIWPTMMAEARKWGVPMVLANAGLLTGRKAVCYPGCEEGWPAGVYQAGKDVFVDGNLITATGPGTALPFGIQILRTLEGDKVADDVASGMLLK